MTSRTCRIPQIGGMFNGDRARKETLVEYGFRLPSALDNRPLRFDEFMSLVPQMINVSATPGEYELELSQGVIVEQIIRPTGLIDPEVEIRPVRGQVDDLLDEIRERVKKRERVLVTTLTKRMAEDLTDYLQQAGVRVRYLHSDIDAIERVEILRGLRLGEFDVLVGINLLREGLDLPEVSLVAILDADQEGFLRSDRSLIQTVRARRAQRERARPFSTPTGSPGSMQRALDEMSRRREIQRAYNIEHNITPMSIVKSLDEVRLSTHVADARTERADPRRKERPEVAPDLHDPAQRAAAIAALEAQMREAAANLEFELAAMLRDQLNDLRAASAPNVVARRGGWRGDESGAARPRRRRRPPANASAATFPPAAWCGCKGHSAPGRPRWCAPLRAAAASETRRRRPRTAWCTIITVPGARSITSIAFACAIRTTLPISIGKR